MQTGCRRGNCPAFTREDGLITLLIQTIFAVAFNVRRQRRAADLINDGIEFTVATETNQAATTGAPFDHFGSQSAVGKFGLRAFAHRFAGPHQSLPNERRDLSHEEDLDPRACLPGAIRHLSQAMADESCGKDTRVIEDQQIRRPQKIRQPIEDRIGEGAARAIDHEQARGVALGSRFLRD